MMEKNGFKEEPLRESVPIPNIVKLEDNPLFPRLIDRDVWQMESLFHKKEMLEPK